MFSTCEASVSSPAWTEGKVNFTVYAFVRQLKTTKGPLLVSRKIYIKAVTVRHTWLYITVITAAVQNVTTWHQHPELIHWENGTDKWHTDANLFHEEENRSHQIGKSRNSFRNKLVRNPGSLASWVFLPYGHSYTMDNGCLGRSEVEWRVCGAGHCCGLW